MMRITRWLCLIVILLALTSCGLRGSASRREVNGTVPAPVEESGAEDTNVDSGEQAETGDERLSNDAAGEEPVQSRPEVTILADGVVQLSRPQLQVAFEVSGRILTVDVTEGETVRTGDVIATIDDSSIREQLRQAELNLRMAELSLRTVTEPREGASEEERAVAEASLRSAQASRDSAQAGLTSAHANRQLAVRALDDLANADGIAQANLESALASLASSQAQLDALLSGPSEDSVRQAELNLEQARNNLSSAELEREVTLLPTSPESVRRRLDTSVANARIAVELAEIAFRRASEGPAGEALASAGAAVSAARAQVAAAQDNVADLDDQLAQAQASVVQADAAVVQAEASVTQAEANLTSLLAGGSVRELAAAEINVEQSELSLSRARRDLESTILRSPANGSVLSVQVSPGAPTGPGNPVVTLLDTTRLEFHTTNVTERDLSGIKPGLSATVTLKTYPDRAIPAQVRRIGLQAGEPVGDSATFPVVLTVEAGELLIIPGMTGRAEIRVNVE